MTGIIDVGGGMRGVYGAGVMDFCMHEGIHFDRCYGVSAGSANMISYMAGQEGRNYRFYTDYSFRKEYMSLSNLVRKGSYLDLDYIYGTLTDAGGEDPLDFAQAIRSGIPLTIVATDAETGKPVYFTEADMRQDDYAPIKASSCVPVLDKPYRIGDHLYFDGGMSDPIPLRRALDDGCDRVVVVLTRPKDFRREQEKDIRLAFLIRKKYPNAAKALAYRSLIYNRELDQAVECEKEGRVLIVAPDSIEGMDTLSRNREAMRDLYQKGYRDAEAIARFLA